MAQQLVHFFFLWKICLKQMTEMNKGSVNNMTSNDIHEGQNLPFCRRKSRHVQSSALLIKREQYAAVSQSNFIIQMLLKGTLVNLKILFVL